MGRKLLTVNRYFNPQKTASILGKLREVVREIKTANPVLMQYKLHDVGFVPKINFIIVKLYFYKQK